MNDAEFCKLVEITNTLDAQQMEDLLHHIGSRFVAKRDELTNMDAVTIGVKCLQASELIRNRSGN